MTSNKTGSSGVMMRFREQDVIGYLVPGTLFLLGLYLYDEIFKLDQFDSFAKQLPTIITDYTKLPGFISLGTFFLFLAYTTGHLISLLSSALIDKLIMERTQGYPFQRLFNKVIGLNTYTRRMKQFYKVFLLFLWFAMFLVAMYGYNAKTILLFIPCIIVLFSKLTMSLLFLRHVDDPWSLKSEDHPALKIANSSWSYFFVWILWPFVKIYNIFSKGVLSAFRMSKPFHVEIQHKFIKKFKDTFDLDPTAVDTEVHWLTYSYLHQNDPSSIKVIRQWLHLYTFARNLSTAFFLLFLYGLVMNNHIDEKSMGRIWILVTWIGFLLFGLRYYYVYYNYYSKYIFRAFITYSRKGAFATVE